MLHNMCIGNAWTCFFGEHFLASAFLASGEQILHRFFLFLHLIPNSFVDGVTVELRSVDSLECGGPCDWPSNTFCAMLLDPAVNF